MRLKLSGFNSQVASMNNSDTMQCVLIGETGCCEVKIIFFGLSNPIVNVL